ncbi:hypothetical protein [Sphingomonas sp.]|jgi:hypothetical protein|uniref:hypothetical protein n=1 Tax=Sphingomonas sp. TaxID=28214 RepID=UPI002EDB0CE0
MTPPQDDAPLSSQDEIRRRQQARATVMAIIMGALVILIFAISIVKIRAGMPHP